MSTDLSSLPPPQIVEALDFESILSERKARLIALTPADQQAALADTLALESEPLTIALQESAYRELLLRARINDSARARLIAFASGSDLDQLGAFYDLARMADESDARYKTRLLLRIAAMAGNGTEEHYRLCALSASLAVVDAAVSSAAPGSVEVAIWVQAEADAAATLAAVSTALNARAVRMLGVTVTAHLARAKPLNITAKLWREPTAPVDLAATLASNLPTIIAAYASLGRDIARSWVSARLHVAGVSRIELITPSEDMPLAQDEYISTGAISILDQGLAW